SPVQTEMGWDRRRSPLPFLSGPRRPDRRHGPAKSQDRQEAATADLGAVAAFDLQLGGPAPAQATSVHLNGRGSRARGIVRAPYMVGTAEVVFGDRILVPEDRRGRIVDHVAIRRRTQLAAFGECFLPLLRQLVADDGLYVAMVRDRLIRCQQIDVA